MTTESITTLKLTVSPQVQTQPLKLEPKIYQVDPYGIKNTGQQQLLFNPK